MSDVRGLSAATSEEGSTNNMSVDLHLRWGR